MQTKVLTAHVPLPLADKVDEIAARLERPRGWIVKQALSAWIDQEEERHRLTLEALADVDRGHVIDHAAVAAWAESLTSVKALQQRRREDALKLKALRMRINAGIDELDRGQFTEISDVELDHYLEGLKAVPTRRRR
jgi:predicted transcriptional regulator